MDTNLKSALVKILTAYDEKKKNNELSKKVNTDSVLSTVSECTASTNSSDVAGASALAEIYEGLNGKIEACTKVVTLLYNNVTSISIDFSSFGVECAFF